MPQNERARGKVYIDRLFKDGGTAEGLLLLHGAQYMRRNDHREALPGLARAAELNPRLPTVHTFYGIAFMDTGDSPGAMADRACGAKATRQSGEPLPEAEVYNGRTSRSEVSPP